MICTVLGGCLIRDDGVFGMKACQKERRGVDLPKSGVVAICEGCGPTWEKPSEIAISTQNLAGIRV